MEVVAAVVAEVVAAEVGVFVEVAGPSDLTPSGQRIHSPSRSVVHSILAASGSAELRQTNSSSTSDETCRSGQATRSDWSPASNDSSPAADCLQGVTSPWGSAS